MRYWLIFSNANTTVTTVTAVVDVLIAAVVSTLLLLLSNVLLSTFLIVSPWRNYLQCNFMRFIMVFTPRKAC